MDDAALVDRARHGDRAAFEQLVVRHQDSLYTMALRMLGRPEDAADVVQEAFLRAYTNLPALAGRTVRPWLFRVTINAAHDVQRRSARRPQEPLEDATGAVIELRDPAAGPEQRVEARERRRAVREALMLLPLDYRTAVVLRDVNDLSYEEMAEALRLPLGTVKSRLSRGRAQLAAILGGSSLVSPAAEELA